MKLSEFRSVASNNKMLEKCIIIIIFIIKNIQGKDLLNVNGIMRCCKGYQ